MWDVGDRGRERGREMPWLKPVTVNVEEALVGPVA
jgi:hypothetical protein